MTIAMEDGHWLCCQILVGFCSAVGFPALDAHHNFLGMTRVDHDPQSHKPDRLQHAHTSGLGTDSKRQGSVLIHIPAAAGGVPTMPWDPSPS